MKRYFLPTGEELVNVHDETLCAHRECVIHKPTNHHMSDWELHWRNDRGIFERICAHGVGHYDPDQLCYHRSIGRESEAIHGCDGCCRSDRMVSTTEGFTP